MKKLGSIFQNTVRSLLPPLFSLIFAVLVISYSGPAVWGEFVQRLIAISLLIQVLSWGHKELLLRSFSRQPSHIFELYYQNLFSRALLLCLFILFTYLFIRNLEDMPWILLWIGASFLYQSFDVLVVYKKTFLFQIIVEWSGFIFTLAGLYYSVELNFTVVELSKWFSLGLAFKALIMSLKMLSAAELTTNISFKIEAYKKGFPFLIIGLSGMLVSKSDLYVLGIMAPNEELGSYQVFITFFVYLQALGSFISTPFLKQMYRINASTFKQISFKFSATGITLSLFALPLIYGLLEHVYSLSFSAWIYFTAFLAVIPVYLYLPRIVMRYKEDNEKDVVYFNLVAALISSVFTYFLYPAVGLLGVAMAVAISQWVLVVLYRWLPQSK